MSPRKVRIIVDSTCDTTPEIKARLHVVPLCVRFGQKEYIDGETITHREFYRMLETEEAMPSTSQPNPATFARVYDEVLAADEDAVVLTVSSALSGTYQSAAFAAMDVSDRIFVVNGKSVAIGTGVLAEHALSLADAGMSAEDIAHALTRLRERVRVLAVIDTLEYLKRGGRISKTAALAGNVLGIKPLLTLRDGKIEPLGKARGTRQGYAILQKLAFDMGGVNFDMPVLLGYTGYSALRVHQFVELTPSLWGKYKHDLRISPIGSVVGTHAGPGAVAVAFIEKE
jgi:DegV family protein with EDD domain